MSWNSLQVRSQEWNTGPKERGRVKSRTRLAHGWCCYRTCIPSSLQVCTTFCVLCASHKLGAGDTTTTGQTGPRPHGGSSLVGRPISKQRNSDCSPGYKGTTGILYLRRPPHLTDELLESRVWVTSGPDAQQGAGPSQCLPIRTGKWGNSPTRSQKSLFGYFPQGSYRPSRGPAP